MTKRAPVKPKRSRAESGGKLLKEKAYDAIKDYILANGLTPGTFMSIGEVAGWLKMSKTPIREAFQILESEGFVTISPQQGIAVRGVSLEELLELFDIRTLLETHVTKRLAGNLTPEQIAQLEENLEAQDVAVKACKQDDSVRVDREFHNLLFDFNGNNQIRVLMINVRDKILRVLGKVYARLGDLTTVTEQHRMILDALKSGDRTAAGKAMRDHLKHWHRLAHHEVTGADDDDDE